MNINELKETKCKKSDNLIINEFSEPSVPLQEQELLINVLRPSDFTKPETQIIICCSNQPWINHLVNSSYFIITKVLYYKPTGLILQIDGFLEEKGLNIKQNKIILSDEEKVKRQERMKEMLNNRKIYK